MAAAKGCVCRSPGDNQLFIDLDSRDAIRRFERLFKAFRDHEACTYTMTQSPGGLPGHVHVVVNLERDVDSPLEQLALQAFLGSDPMRELLNWRRLESGVPHEANNMLFERSENPPPLSWFRRLYLRLVGVL